MRRYRLASIVALAGFFAVGGSYWAFDEWWFRSERDELRRELAQGRHAKALPRLVRLTARRPNDGELQFQLGICESVMGREQDAMSAWARVPADSPYSGQAAVQLARRELAMHHLANAEVLLPKALGDHGDHSLEAFETLLNLYRIEGRFDEAVRLAWGYSDRYPDQMALLREIAQLGSIKAHKLDYTRGLLDAASKTSPNDDRLWLGWANFAIRVGRFDHAARWLDRCLERRPEDAAIWRSRLNLALATQDVSGAWQAVGHMTAAAVEPAEVLFLRAWFARLATDDAKERRALTELLTIETANFSAIERLAELELRAGCPEQAAKLRARKAELDNAKAEYDRLLTRPEAGEHVIELAHLAETLGRFPEARMLWKIAKKQRPRDPGPIAALTRLDRADSPPPPPNSSLPALLAERTESGLDQSQAPTLPLTAARPIFSDDAESVNLKFRFDNGANPDHLLSQAMGGGIGLLDFDGDGWLDVYCVQGFSSPTAARSTSGDRLFRNRGDGTFLDVTAASGIESMPRGYGHGVAVGDFDNDGRPDLFVTRMDSYALYRNKGDGTFEDATQAWGLGGSRDWPTSAAFADLDGDGDLDLYVCHYAEWDPKNPKVCHDEVTKKPVVCQPLSLRSRPDHLFRNDGGKFVDVTVEAGIVDTHGEGLGVVACDLDKDGRVDLFVANDQSANFLFRNVGGLRFEEDGEMRGVGSSADGVFSGEYGRRLRRFQWRRPARPGRDRVLQ